MIPIPGSIPNGPNPPTPRGTIEVDARGLRCPLPVIRLGAAARDAPAGTRIVVLASDPAARHDIPAWCRMRDHELREMTEVATTETSRPTDPTGPTDLPRLANAADPSDPEGAADPAGTPDPAYLRFVVVI